MSTDFVEAVKKFMEERLDDMIKRLEIILSKRKTVTLGDVCYYIANHAGNEVSHLRRIQVHAYKTPVSKFKMPARFETKVKYLRALTSEHFILQHNPIVMYMRRMDDTRFTQEAKCAIHEYVESATLHTLDVAVHLKANQNCGITFKAPDFLVAQQIVTGDVIRV